MSHNNDNSGMLYIGGIAVIIIIIGFLIKILKSIMIELSQLFTAIGKMAEAFISMAWQIAQIMGLLALGVAAIYAAWIFSKKYYKLVKDATEVKAQIENRFSNLQSEFEDAFNLLKRNAIREISQMRKELDDALKRSEVVPEIPSISTESPTTSDSNQLAASIANQSNDEQTHQLTTQLQDAPKDISNPF
tara:strand:- start:276587 stop:277156 length:570 start_codon:yes stop_codon:yes gene_type:complete